MEKLTISEKNNLLVGGIQVWGQYKISLCTNYAVFREEPNDILDYKRTKVTNRTLQQIAKDLGVFIGAGVFPYCTDRFGVLAVLDAWVDENYPVKAAYLLSKKYKIAHR